MADLMFAAFGQVCVSIRVRGWVDAWICEKGNGNVRRACEMDLVFLTAFWEKLEI